MVKAKSLSIQIWLWFIGCIGISGVLITIIIYGALEVNLKEQLFSNIEAQQYAEITALQSAETQESKKSEMTTIEATPSIGKLVAAEAKPSEEVKHIVTTDNNLLEEAKGIIPAKKAPIARVGENGIETKGRYETENVYFVIDRQLIDDEYVYIYSYVAKNLRQEVLSKFWYVFFAIFVVILIMFIPAHVIAKRLSKPLVKLGRDMESIAKRQWNKPITLKGSEEFVILAESCESMRQQLIAYDNKQQDMLQSISHELKTPIMVIRSYVQAMKEGLYPKGSLDTTLDTIDQETNRLQKKVLDLIYITNLDYLTTHYRELKQDDVNLTDVIQEVYERLQYRRTDVGWDLDIEKILIKGDQEHWKVVIENILQNALRYSRNKIKISLKEESNQAICRIYNNGHPIEESKKDKLFNVFQKGSNGESGLGLNIVKRIVDLYEGKVWFDNEKEGVSFYISIPLIRNTAKENEIKGI